MPDQSDAASMLRANVAAGVFNVTLLDGVTGSGKTEVYFEAVAAALDQGKQVLILLPEIALTHAFLERFQQRFGAKPARMAFRPAAQDARKSLAASGGRRRARRCRRALGAVPAVQGTWPDRRRRGARPRLQAGGPRLLQCARHGGGARPYRRLSGGAGVGDAVGRKPGQCEPGPLRQGRAFRRASPRRRCRS